MTTSLPKSILLLLLSFLFALPSAEACINPDSTATLAFNINEEGTEAEIRIGNLRLETESPNIFCSCALDSYSDVLNFVSYIAFVYQGTNDIYPNFEPFMASQAASDAWDNSLPNFPGWDGYISEVINDGLSTSDAVEMIIRLQPPSGSIISSSEVDSILAVTYLATDMWDETTETIAEDHQGLRNLYTDMGEVVINFESNSYFEDLDAALIVSTNTPSILTRSLQVTPNPATEKVLLSYTLERNASVELVIYDLLGKPIYRQQQLPNTSGKHEIPLDLNQLLSQSGTYMIGLKNDQQQEYIKLIKI